MGVVRYIIIGTYMHQGPRHLFLSGPVFELGCQVLCACDCARMV